MLAIDPGTSIAIIGILTFIKGGILHMVSEHCVACRICNPRIGQNPLENRSYICSKTYLQTILYTLSSTILVLILHLFYYKLDGQSLPYGQRLQHEQRTPPTQVISTLFSTRTSTWISLRTTNETRNVTQELKTKETQLRRNHHHLEVLRPRCKKFSKDTNILFMKNQLR